MIHRIKELVGNNLELIKYHKLDGLMPESSESLEKLKMDTKCKHEMAFNLLSQFKNANVPFIVLKGLANAYTIYDNYWERLANDVDIFINEKFLVQAEHILTQCGYVQGDFDYENNCIIKAPRKEIMHRKLFTHELYPYCKIEKALSEIDINFRFSWLGIQKKIKYLLEDAIDSSVDCFIINNEKFPCLCPTMNFIHQCIHIYNEAVLFVFSQYEPYTDTEELKLFRFIDIIKFLDILDFDKIFHMAEEYNFLKELSFVIKICDILFPNNINSHIKDVLQLNNIDVNYFFTKDGEKKYWNISILDRMFNLKKKMDAIKKMTF